MAGWWKGGGGNRCILMGRAIHAAVAWCIYVCGVRVFCVYQTTQAQSGRTFLFDFPGACGVRVCVGRNDDVVQVKTLNWATLIKEEVHRRRRWLVSVNTSDRQIWLLLRVFLSTFPQYSSRWKQKKGVCCRVFWVRGTSGRFRMILVQCGLVNKRKNERLSVDSNGLIGYAIIVDRSNWFPCHIHPNARWWRWEGIG